MAKQTQTNPYAYTVRAGESSGGSITSILSSPFSVAGSALQDAASENLAAGPIMYSKQTSPGVVLTPYQSLAASLPSGAGPLQGQAPAINLRLARQTGTSGLSNSSKPTLSAASGYTQPLPIASGQLLPKAPQQTVKPPQTLLQRFGVVGGGAIAGFFVGGPIGAAVGAAAGYVVKKKVGG